MNPDYDLGVIGNGRVAALVDRNARLGWCCLPRFDSEPVFDAALTMAANEAEGFWDVSLVRAARASQHYREHTAILVTRLEDDRGGALDVVDFVPRDMTTGEAHPRWIVRRLQPVSGSPQVQVRVRPRGYRSRGGPTRCAVNQIRYPTGNGAWRLTTDVASCRVIEETPFLLDRAVDLIFGGDEPVPGALHTVARRAEDATTTAWHAYVRGLSLPVDWQDPVIRAAITLKLCTYEDSGGIVGALTPSPLAAPRTLGPWDLRHCVLRDAHGLVRALMALGETPTLEQFLLYLRDVATLGSIASLHPAYGIVFERELAAHGAATGRPAKSRPVRDVAQAASIGDLLLGYSHAFFDKRLLTVPTERDFERCERLAGQAFGQYRASAVARRDALPRTRTQDAVLWWAACDRIARIAAWRGAPLRGQLWRNRADSIKSTVLREAWRDELKSYVTTFGGVDVDPDLLSMVQVGFVHPREARWIATLGRIGSDAGPDGTLLGKWRRSDGCTAGSVTAAFWYAEALADAGQLPAARERFGALLARRTPLGLFADGADPGTGSLWCAYPRTSALSALINTAARLSRAWEEVR